MTLVHDAAETHPRLEQLLRNEDVVWQYVHDYGKGSVKIADLTHDGTIAWTEDLRGVEYGDEEPLTIPTRHPMLCRSWLCAT